MLPVVHLGPSGREVPDRAAGCLRAGERSLAGLESPPSAIPALLLWGLLSQLSLDLFLCPLSSLSVVTLKRFFPHCNYFPHLKKIS